MTDTITPALTPEQWEHLRAYTERNYSVFTHDWMLTAFLGMDRHDARHTMLPEHSPTDPAPHVLMALANAALPDDDRRKITRADVQAVLDANQGIENEFNQGDERLDLLAAKLTRLLPPD